MFKGQNYSLWFILIYNAWTDFKIGHVSSKVLPNFSSYWEKRGHSLQSCSYRLSVYCTKPQSLFMLQAKTVSDHMFAIVIDPISATLSRLFHPQMYINIPWAPKFLFLSLMPSVYELGVLSLVMKDCKLQWLVPGLLFHNVEHLLLLRYCISA